MARSMLHVASKTGSWAMCQSSERTLMSGYLGPYDLFNLLGARPLQVVAAGRRSLAQAAAVDHSRDRQRTRTSSGPEYKNSAPEKSRSRPPPPSIQEWLPEFYKACDEYPHSTRALRMLRSVYFFRMEVVENHVPDLVPGIMRVVNLSVDPEIVHGPGTPATAGKGIGEGEAATAASNPGATTATDGITPAASRTSRLDTRDLLLLLNNLSRVTKKHTPLKRALGPQYRYSVEMLLKVAANDESLYTNPSYVGQFATAITRLNMNVRPFWRNMHEGLLDSWDARSAAAVISACGCFHRGSGAVEGRQRTGTSQCTDSVQLTDPETNIGKASAVEAAVRSAPEATSHEASGTTSSATIIAGDAAEESTASVLQSEEATPDSSATVDTLDPQGGPSGAPDPFADTDTSTSAAYGAGREPQKDKMQRIQLMILEKYIDMFNAHGVELCVLSFAKQRMLHGRALELLQDAVRRAAPDLAPDQLAAVLFAFYRSGTPLGCAEPILHERALGVSSVLPKMRLVHALRCLQMFRAWGWPHQATQEWFLDKIRNRTARLTISECAKSLAILAELEHPVEKSHAMLVSKLSGASTNLPGDVLREAKVGLEYILTSTPTEGSSDGIDLELVRSTLQNVETTLMDIEKLFASRRTGGMHVG